MAGGAAAEETEAARRTAESRPPVTRLRPFPHRLQPRLWSERASEHAHGHSSSLARRRSSLPPTRFRSGPTRRSFPRRRMRATRPVRARGADRPARARARPRGARAELPRLRRSRARGDDRGRHRPGLRPTLRRVPSVSAGHRLRPRLRAPLCAAPDRPPRRRRAGARRRDEGGRGEAPPERSAVDSAGGRWCKKATAELSSKLEARNKEVVTELETTARSLGFGIRAVQGGRPDVPHPPRQARERGAVRHPRRVERSARSAKRRGSSRARSSGPPSS